VAVSLAIYRDVGRAEKRDEKMAVNCNDRKASI